MGMHMFTRMLCTSTPSLNTLRILNTTLKLEITIGCCCVSSAFSHFLLAEQPVPGLLEVAAYPFQDRT